MSDDDRSTWYLLPDGTVLASWTQYGSDETGFSTFATTRRVTPDDLRRFDQRLTRFVWARLVLKPLAVLSVASAAGVAAGLVLSVAGSTTPAAWLLGVFGPLLAVVVIVGFGFVALVGARTRAGLTRIQEEAGLEPSVEEQRIESARARELIATPGTVTVSRGRLG